MKQRLKIVSIAMLGLGITGLLLAGLSAHAGTYSKKHGNELSKWDSDRGVKRVLMIEKQD